VDSTRTGFTNAAVAVVSVCVIEVGDSQGSPSNLTTQETYTWVPLDERFPDTFTFLHKFPQPIRDRLERHFLVQHSDKLLGQPLDPVCNVHLATPHGQISAPSQLVEKYGLTDFSTQDSLFKGLWTKDRSPFDVKGKIMHIVDINGKDHPIPMIPDVRFSADAVYTSIPVFDPHTSNFM
jgi:hypothetical protein